MAFKKHNLVYKTTNLVNGKIYIGVHSADEIEDGYLGSGKVFKKALIKYGLDNFYREVLFDFATPEEAYRKEAELVTKDFVEKKDNYNFKTGGEFGLVSEETRKKQSLASPKIWLGKRGEEIPWFGKPISKERKEHLSKIRMREGNPMWGRRGGLHVNFGLRISKEERLDKKFKKIELDGEFANRIKDIENSDKKRGWKRHLAQKWGVHPRTALMFIRRWWKNDVNRERKCLSCGVEIHADGEYCRECFYESMRMDIFKDWDLESLIDLKQKNSINALSKRFNVSWQVVKKSLERKGL